MLAHPTSDRLRQVTGLSRPSFFRAQREVLECGLVKVAHESGRRAYFLVSPPPYPLERSLNIETGRSHRRDSTISSVRLRNPRRPLQSRHSDPPTTTDNNSVRETVRKVFGQRLGVEIRADAVENVLASAQAVATEPGRLADAAHSLSLNLQAEGILTWENQVREGLQDVVAVLNPVVRAAMRIFNGVVLEVRKMSDEVKT